MRLTDRTRTWQRSASTLAFCLLLIIARGDGLLVQPADTDYSGDIDRDEVLALETRWRSGEDGLLNPLTQAGYLQRNGGCYQYNPVTSDFETRKCEPVVASPPVMFYRQTVNDETVSAPTVVFYRERLGEASGSAPTVMFYRQRLWPDGGSAPTVMFARIPLPENQAKAPTALFTRRAPPEATSGTTLTPTATPFQAGLSTRRAPP